MLCTCIWKSVNSFTANWILYSSRHFSLNINHINCLFNPHLLYYFNFVQVTALTDAANDDGGPGGAGITKYVAPKALFWFRWAALVTWLTGAAFLLHRGQLDDAFALGMLANSPSPAYELTIGIGAWLGTIMLFNVWGLIWPNQKKILGLVEASADEIAKARKVAFMASRSNTLMSIPLVMSMVSAGGHGFFM